MECLKHWGWLRLRRSGGLKKVVCLYLWQGQKEEDLHLLSGNVVGLGFHCAHCWTLLCLTSKDELSLCGQVVKKLLQKVEKNKTNYRLMQWCVLRNLKCDLLTSYHNFISTIITSTESLLPTWRPTVDTQTRLHLGLIVNGESPQIDKKLRLVSLEVSVEKFQRPSGGPRTSVSGIGFPEAVQVELTDKAGKVGRFEDVSVVRGDAVGTQEEFLEEMLINDNDLTAAIPADGSVRRVVHQTPQFGRKIVGVDGVRE